MTESAVNNYDVYEALGEKEEIIQNDYTCPPRRFVNKNAKVAETEGQVSLRRNSRISSKTEDYDPDKLSLKMVKNQINHLQYRPELFQPDAVRHVRKVL
jgi:hypothetical protein